MADLSYCLAGPIAKAIVTTQALTEHLRGWIEDHGGYIHPDVTLSNSPAFGCRYSAYDSTQAVQEHLEPHPASQLVGKTL